MPLNETETLSLANRADKRSDMHMRREWRAVMTTPTTGRFERSISSFRNWITSDGSPGPTGQGGFAAESGRYHLYVSLACPWAHRTLIMRMRKGLCNHVGISIVHWRLDERGWNFSDGPGVTPDPVIGARFLSEIYQAADVNYQGRYTVPLLWDRKRATIVNNESSEIIRMFDLAFETIAPGTHCHYPCALRAEIDEVNSRVYSGLNNGVYSIGFATTQQAYEAAFWPLVETLEWLEARLAMRRYLVGSSITEADIRLFTTLVRFDAVYYSHFKCNYRRIADYSNLLAYLNDLYQSFGFGSTVNFDHIKRHYYESHRNINSAIIVPLGPELTFDRPHDRARLS